MQFTNPSTSAPIILIGGSLPSTPTDNPTVLFNGDPDPTTGALNTSKYNSVEIYVDTAATAVNLTLTWRAPAGAANTIWNDAFSCPAKGTADGMVAFRTPAKGVELVINADAHCTMRVIGSSQTVPETRYANYTEGTPASGSFSTAVPGDGLVIWGGVTVPHGGVTHAIAVDVPSGNGPAVFSVVNTTGAGGPLVGTIVDAITGIAVAAVAATAVAAGAQAEDTILLPCRPIRLRLENDDPTNDTGGKITLVYNTL